MRLLPASAHRRMPWKNGGGETTEIIISPEGAGLVGFDWRISMAKVGTDGPFSSFPGIDRTLAVLAGEGIALSIAGVAEIALTTTSPPFAFAGDATAVARLVAGPIIDLNVMTRHGAWRHEVKRLHVTGSRALSSTADIVAILSRSGDLRVAADGRECRLGIDDAAVLEGPAAYAVEAMRDTSLFVIELRRTS